MALALDGAIAVAILPWMWRLSASLGHWATRNNVDAATGLPLTEIPLKLAYWTMSFVIGETALGPIL